MDLRKETKGLRTWVEIDQSAIRHNFFEFHKLVPKNCKKMAVVKSNAYGHGIRGCGRLFEKLGADFLGVDSITEALALRGEGIKTPILILGYTLPERLADASQNNIAITVSNFETIKAILKSKTPLTIHIKIDTGMHRQGFLLESLEKAIKKILKNDSIKIEGIYSHFAAAKLGRFRKETERQITVFERACAVLRGMKIDVIRHIAASSGTLNYPESHFDMVRIGIGNYGLWPVEEIHNRMKDRATLEPALSWRSIIAEIKEAKKGEGIGYDLTDRLKRNSTIAIIPIGYWHGFKRCLSSRGQVLIRGKKARVLGRVCMDMFVIDVTDIKGAKVGDMVTLIGKDGNSTISAEDFANLCKTSNYETVTQLNPLMKRIYI